MGWVPQPCLEFESGPKEVESERKATTSIGEGGGGEVVSTGWSDQSACSLPSNFLSLTLQYMQDIEREGLPCSIFAAPELAGL